MDNILYCNEKMKKLIILLLLLVLASACSKANQAKDSIDAQIESIKEGASEVENLIPVSGNQSGAEGQTVYVPVPQLQAQQGDNIDDGDIFSPSYRAPCTLQKYKILNKYCSAKTYWQQQSEIISWRISYSIILLGLVILVFALWWISRKSRS